jgi:HAD superfamily hydrolase (TIGR01490 family)
MHAGIKLALFDLDNTLLTGDSDVLWCEFLMATGVVDATTFAVANADMDTRYRAGTATAQAFCEFYVSTLTNMPRPRGEELRRQFFSDWIRPRIPADAVALVKKHQDDGDRVVMTTATNRFITELTADYFGIADLIATEVEEVEGVFTGRTRDVLNMREGKVVRIERWLAEQGMSEELLKTATFYSDSINDLPLLLAVGVPVVVDGDARLLGEARGMGWSAISLRRS